MAYSSLLIIFLFIFHYSVELPSTTNGIINEKYSRDLPLFIHPVYFISNICRQQKQYSMKITRKFCSEYSQENHRDKRVGWTISV
jgi:hypothetical protein